MTQVEWGRDEDNYPVYYDEQVVGEIIDFESNLVNLMRDGDEAVLGSIDPDSNLYTEISALSGQGMKGDFEKLEIGEIRQAGNHYYVWAVSYTHLDVYKRQVYRGICKRTKL